MIILVSVISGVLSFELGLAFVVARAHILRPDRRRLGGMAAIASSEEVIQRHIENLGFGDHIVVAVYNGLESLVVSGDLAPVESLISAVRAEGIRAVKLNIDQGTRIKVRFLFILTALFRIPQPVYRYGPS